MKLKLWIMFLVSCLFLASCQEQPLQNNETPKDGVFIHISHGKDDVHRVLMALQMAVLMSEDKDVLVYFDINGIDVVLKDTEELLFSHFPGSKTQIKKLLASNVTLMACPGCLKAAEKTPADLMEGIQIADKNVFFNFTKGRILTIDY